MSNLQDDDDNNGKHPKTADSYGGESSFQDDDEYCRALALAIYKGKCPMTVGLYVPWGRCKDALLRSIKKHLDDISKKPKNGKTAENDNNGNIKHTIKQFFELVFRMLFYIPIIRKEHEKYEEQHNIFFEFSAWHCTGCDRLWAGLITTLCDEVEDEFGRIPISLYRALYKENKITEESESKELRKDNEPTKKSQPKDLYEDKVTKESESEEICKVKLTEESETKELYKNNKPTEKSQPKEWVAKEFLTFTDWLLTLLVIFFLICALLFQFLLHIFKESEYYNRLKDYMLYASATTFGTFLLLQSGMTLKVLKNYIITQKGELMSKLKRTDMSSQLGFMNDVKKEVEIITSYLQMMEVFQRKKMRVIIKITKLDKCMPDRVVEVLHAINVLLSNPDAPFICILAVDPGIIVECVEKSDLLKGMANNGYLFLNRIVTLAFSIPKMNDETKCKYLKQIISGKSSPVLQDATDTSKIIDRKSKQIYKAKDMKESTSENSPLTQGTIDPRGIDQDRKRTPFIDEALKSLFEKYCEYITDNTINMKRIVNTIIITFSLMMKESKFESINKDKVTKWVIMAAQWPCSLSWILQCIEDEQQSREAKESEQQSREAQESEQQSREAQERELQSREAQETEQQSREAQETEQQSREAQETEQQSREAQETEQQSREAQETEQQSREAQDSDTSRKKFCDKQLWEIYEMSLDALHANRESLQHLLELDGDPDILYKLLKKTEFTVDDANLLRNYTFNLDHTIQRKIELLQGSFNFLRFKEDKTLNRMTLLEMDTKAVCDKMKDLKLHHKDYLEKIEEHNLNGKALLYSDNNEIRKALGMNMGDWVKFRAAFLSLPTPNLYF